MLKKGIYLPPSPFETNFVSTAHTKSDVAKTLVAADEAFRLLKRK
jgi:glutamate-1-semialdehyde 2,1-aminomutase